MSKRKNRSSSPNLPQSALERARQQLNEQSGEPAAAEAPAEVGFAPVAAAPKAAPVAAAPKAAPAATKRSTRRPGTQSVQSKGGRKSEMDAQYIRNRLENPTRTVSIDELRKEYGYVIHDLRTMAILAVGLIIALVVLGQLVH